MAMGHQIASLFVKLGADTTDLDRGLAMTNAGLKDTAHQANQTANVLKFGLAVAGAAAAAGIGSLAMSTVQAASNMSESINKNRVVFAAASAEVEKFAATAATSLGQSSQLALESAATFGNLFSSVGMTREEAAKMSMGLVKLASDLGSFNNIDPSVALEKLRAGLVGETEPLRTLGINLSAAAVELKAVDMGLGKNYESLSESQKMLARYNIILDQSKNAQDDFARTSDGMANATRIIEASLEDARIQLGQKFLPAVAPVVAAMSKSLPGALDVAVDGLGALMGAGAGAIGILDGISRAALGAADAVTHIGGAQWEALPDNPELAQMFAPLPGKRPAGIERREAAAAEAAAAKATAATRAWRELEGQYYRTDQAAAKVKAAMEAAAASDEADRWKSIAYEGIENAKQRMEEYVDAQEEARRGAARMGDSISNAMQKAEGDAADLKAEIAGIGLSFEGSLIATGERLGRSINEATIDAHRQLAAIENRAMLDASTAARKGSLNARLSDIERTHKQEVEDREALWQLEYDLAHESDEDRKKAIQERYDRERDLIAHRRQLEQSEATWYAENIEKPRAELERELAEEARNRERAAINEGLSEKIAALKEGARAELAEAESTAKAKLAAVQREYWDKLPDAAKGGLQGLAGSITATVGAAMADLASTAGAVSAAAGLGGGDPNAGRWEDGVYRDPAHEPAGEIFEIAMDTTSTACPVGV
ncbi:MAG: hypothetical protein ACYC3V_20000 [Chloroflexota bacterium]